MTRIRAVPSICGALMMAYAAVGALTEGATIAVPHRRVASRAGTGDIARDLPA